MSKNSKPTTRSSTKFTVIVGYILVFLAAFIVIYGVMHGVVNSNNIVEILWCLLIGATSFLGVNLTRVTFENVAKIKQGVDPLTNSPIAPPAATPEVLEKSE